MLDLWNTQFQDELSVSGSGTVVVRSPRGSQSFAPFRDQSSSVWCHLVILKCELVISFLSASFLFDQIPIFSVVWLPVCFF